MGGGDDAYLADFAKLAGARPKDPLQTRNSTHRVIGQPPHATLALSLCSLIRARFSFEMIAFACSLETSTKACRARRSTLPTTPAGSPVSPRILSAMSLAATPMVSPT